MDEETRLSPACPRCGRPLPADAPQELCPACLLAAATETLTRSSADEAPTVSSAGTASTRAGAEARRLAEGEPWGPYRIGRLLGRGGMGEVYEAEHAESGRRLALKVLRSRLGTAEDRARFLREGQLAASISHPHTVYIFGSEEIGGTPVIAMELLPGGTLKDRVSAGGPLPPAQAVSIVLDIIGGLDAAHAGGILHRDIKPSNCFVDAEGAVKVGDFGLSISTLARDVHHQLQDGSFQGTPQFAPPEQLRGEPLDVRADIYAVGATLFYLLTGRPPFESRDLRELVERVTSEAPPSPARLRPGIPQGLAALVMACLAKKPAARPSSYAALAEALEPYARAGETPAHPAARLAAGVIDAMIVGVPGTLWRTAQLDVSTTPDLMSEAAVTAGLWTWALGLGYYAAIEGRWRTSIGKRILGLRLSPASGRAWWRAIALRTAVFGAPGLALWLVVLAAGPLPPLAAGRVAPNVTLNATDMQGVSHSLAGLLLLGLLFVSLRRHNGWAALHDLASGTRVVARAAVVRRAGTDADAAPVVSGSRADGHVGPFTVVGDGGETGSGRLRLGFDPVLRRRVWIHEVAPGTPPIGGARRDVSRVGRLHWLAGRRSAAENWDAFEAPDGRPWLQRRDAAPGWPALKAWLLDLSAELDAATRDGSLPDLGLDRLWLRGDGRLVLLDFRAPGTTTGGREAGGRSNGLSPVALLSAVAGHSLARGGVREPDTCRMPLSARVLLDRWSGADPPALGEMRAALVRAAGQPDRASRARRAVPIVLAAGPAVVTMVSALLVLPSLFRVMSPQNQEMLGWLDALSRPEAVAEGPLRDPEYRGAAEQYVAARFGHVLRDETFWRMAIVQQFGEARRAAAGILERHPSVSAGELDRATAILASEVERRRAAAARESADAGRVWSVVILMQLAMMAAVALGVSLVSSILVPGGVLTRLLGLAVVTRAGTRIGRVRSGARVLLAWLPALVWGTYLLAVPDIQGWVPAVGAVLAFGTMLAAAAWTIAHPARGPHDRLARTWVVPR